MKTTKLIKNTRIWCWWKSRFLYFTGTQINGKYKFVDIADVVIWLTEKEVTQLG